MKERNWNFLGRIGGVRVGEVRTRRESEREAKRETERQRERS